jgi:hypothetical protein
MSMKDQTERWLLAACTLVLLLAQIRSVYARVRDELRGEIQRSA